MVTLNRIIGMLEEQRRESLDQLDAIDRAIAALKSLAAHGQQTPLITGQPEAPSTQLVPQDAILFDQIGDGLQLSMVQPAGQRCKQHPHGHEAGHGGSLHE